MRSSTLLPSWSMKFSGSRAKTWWASRNCSTMNCSSSFFVCLSITQVWERPAGVNPLGTILSAGGRCVVYEVGIFASGLFGASLRPGLVPGRELFVLAGRIGFFPERFHRLQELLLRPRFIPRLITRRLPLALLRGLPSLWSMSFASPFLTSPARMARRRAVFRAALSFFALAELWYLEYSRE